MKELQSVDRLALGMFVSELDVPWLETPFLMQGFLIENEQEINELRKYCRFVTIDRSRSTGDQFRDETPEAGVAPAMAYPRVPQEIPSPAKSSRVAAPPPPMLDVFRDVFRDAGTSAVGASDTPPQARVGSRKVAPSVGGEDDFLPPPSHTGGRAGDWVKSLFKRLKGEKETPTPTPALTPAARKGLHGTDNGSYFRTNTRLVVQVPIEVELPQAHQSYTTTRQVFSELIQDIRSNRPLETEQLRDAADQMVESASRNPDAMLWMAKLKRTDRYSYDHAIDVSVHLTVFALHLALPQEQIRILAMAGLMQDLGKIRVASSLLRKEGPLDDSERKQMEQHVDLASEVMGRMTDVPKQLVDIVNGHHERWDGSGYPERLAGDKIPLAAQMAGIVDSYCAMIMDRPYAEAISAQAALEQIAAMRGSKFSTELVDQLIQCLGIYPVGTLVELNTGEVGVVIEQNRIRRLKPRVLVLLGPDKSRNPHPNTLKLIYDPIAFDNEPYRIVAALPKGSYGLDHRDFYL
jgi:HD-GYP domain-containing protein (c-di-GMP phosphodiesterase class II)